MNFLDHLEQGTNQTRTENNAVTNKSSLNPNLDYFALAGAMRGRAADATVLFERAYHTDRQLAIRTLFYLRDIRGGQGERDIFNACLLTLIRINPELGAKMLRFVPEYGRWDEVWKVGRLFPESKTAAVEMIKTQLESDESAMAEGKSVSLLAKWLPSENTSSDASKMQARQLAKELGLKPSQYRKKIVALRKHIHLLEQDMSTNKWSEVDYSKLPSQAGRKHSKAFKRHDESRYTDFLNKAVKGEVKMNTATLFTYEVFDEVQKGNGDAADAMWANLPDYTQGNNALVLADVSGSMNGRPMSISVSLALYFAEHNKGPFHNKFMTFTSQPQLVTVQGKTLRDKLRMIQSSDWSMSTSLEAALMVILNAGVASGANGDDMPKVLYIISDMEFDEALLTPGKSIFDGAKQKFAEAGLPMPHVVFWNVDARQDQAPATKFDNNVTLISGSSQSTFRYAVGGKTPEESMLDILNSERYARIVVS